MFLILPLACSDGDDNTPTLSVTKSVGNAPPWAAPGPPGDDGEGVLDPNTGVDDPDAPKPAESCFGAQDCDDENACTTDACTPENSCKHELLLSCCLADYECPDVGQCATGVCVDNACTVETVADCCNSAVECDDGNECTDDACTIADGGGAVCENSPIAGCCTVAFSNALNASSEVEGWGHEAAEPGVGWQIWNSRFVSPPASLYMGDPKTGNYINHSAADPDELLKTEASIASEKFKLTKNAQTAVVDLQLWVDVEDCEGESFWFDIFRVMVDTPQVPGIIMLDKCDVSEYRKWVPISIELTPFLGDVINLRFDFDSIDGKFNDGEGIYVDDIRVKTCY